MSIEFRCSSCGKLLRVGDEAAGRPVQCPECKQIGTAPAGAAGGGGGFAGAGGGQSGAPPEQSPFAPAAQSGFPPEQNPFQSPTHGAGPPADYQYGSPYAANRVFGPAIGLIVAAAIVICVMLLGAAGQIANLAVMQRMGNVPPPQAPFGPEFPVISVCVYAGFAVLLNILVIVGAVKMKNLESWGLALTAAILAVIPCISSCCCILEIPFGIWALVVLNDPAVRAAFRR